jgi:hypothetical protein
MHQPRVLRPARYLDFDETKISRRRVAIRRLSPYLIFCHWLQSPCAGGLGLPIGAA